MATAPQQEVLARYRADARTPPLANVLRSTALLHEAPASQPPLGAPGVRRGACTSA